jgi:D-sedoheptulose 7-phosphate isomerase
MEEILKKSILESIDLKKKILDEKYLKVLHELGERMVDCISKGGKIMLCGNGGSAADAQHLAAEFLVRLRPKINRNPLPAITLAQDTSTITACGNDFGFEKLFERNLMAIGKQGDILICISTSGKSENIKLAAKASNENGIYCFGFLGNDGGTVKDFCNNYIIIPSNNTARIQEAHITIGHVVMEYVETELLRKNIIKLN